MDHRKSIWKILVCFSFLVYLIVFGYSNPDCFGVSGFFYTIKETLMSVMSFKEIQKLGNLVQIMPLGVENLGFHSGFATNWLSNFGQVILTLWV